MTYLNTIHPQIRIRESARLRKSDNEARVAKKKPSEKEKG